jgi:adenylosuccinate synthase
MSVTAVVGANWGDEGKGRMVDALCAEHDVVVRFQGGGNAGHTVITDQGKFVLHLLPSGALRPGTVNVLGPGVALDAGLLARELRGLAERGIPAPTLLVSGRAQLLMQHHRHLDTYEEERLAERSFGSTRSGIAPFYSDKVAKLGIRVDDLFDTERLRQRITPILSTKNILCGAMYNAPAFELDHVLAELARARELLAPFACDTTEYLHAALGAGQRILVEGQLGALRDPDHGIYPWVTSSSPLAGFATVGAGLPPPLLTRIVAVTKAYSSAVGAGPFVTELSGDEASELRERGGDAGEYGATTGRPRRVGWFDAVATRYGCRVQGATEVALTGRPRLPRSHSDLHGVSSRRCAHRAIPPDARARGRSAALRAHGGLALSARRREAVRGFARACPRLCVADRGAHRRARAVGVVWSAPGAADRTKRSPILIKNPLFSRNGQDHARGAAARGRGP